MNCTCNAYKFPHRPGSGECQIPECKNCQWGQIEVDPHNTGDKWYREIHCNALKCPWGKE